jgi:prolipoprotein diacylglyceryl transferase
VIASIPSPPDNGIQIGPFLLHAYGVLYAVAVVAAVIITRRRWAARGGDPELVDEVALWGFPAGLIGGRLYHVITSWNEVPHTWWGPFAVWKGGLGIWGGIALGVIVGLWRVKKRGADVPAFMDAGAPALLVAQSIGRVGNWFNQELFGKPTNLPWGLKIDPEHRPAQYAHDATFHPTFLYEIVWNLSLAGFLVWLGHHRGIRPPGLLGVPGLRGDDPHRPRAPLPRPAPEPVRRRRAHDRGPRLVQALTTASSDAVSAGSNAA